MISYNKMPELICKMWNVKCENAQHVQNFKRFVNVSNLDIIRITLETPELFFSLTFNKFFINHFW